MLLTDLHSREVLRAGLCGVPAVAGEAAQELGRRVRPRVFAGHQRVVTSCDFSPTGGPIALCFGGCGLVVVVGSSQPRFLRGRALKVQI